VNDKPTQSIFVIKYKERQILIPINEEIIKEIDRKNKSIYISAPNGLIDLYLE
jgi:16S rRNA processing protein RimM